VSSFPVQGASGDLSTAASMNLQNWHTVVYFILTELKN
jgi:hypothetical protein